jgi:hypothetical protein
MADGRLRNLPVLRKRSSFLGHGLEENVSAGSRCERKTPLMIRQLNSVFTSHPFRKERGMDGAPTDWILIGRSVRLGWQESIDSAKVLFPEKLASCMALCLRRSKFGRGFG